MSLSTGSTESARLLGGPVAAGEPGYLVGGVRLPRPFSILRFGHMGLNARDIDVSLEFYRNLLGLRQTDIYRPTGVGKPIGYFLSFGGDHHSLVIIDAQIGGPPDDRYRHGITLNQVSFQVGTLAEVVAARDYLVGRKRDVWKVGRDFPGSNFAIYAWDPDGYRVELFYGMEQIGWDRLSKPTSLALGVAKVPALPHLSEIQEIEAARGDGQVDLYNGFRSDDPLPSSFEVGGVRLPRPFKVVDQGPLSLFVADVEASTNHYMETYGFKLTEEVVYRGYRCTYLRVGNNHHALAFIPMTLRDELNSASDSTVMAIGFRVGSYAQLRDAVTFLRSAGVVVETDVYRELHPGVEEAAYVIDPDGNRLMLYCAIEQIGWDGRARPVDARRRISPEWPDALSEVSDTYEGRTFQGPLG